MKRIAIYYRVSTDKQELDSQKREVSRWLASQPTQPDKIYYFEENGSGRKEKNRPKFLRLLGLAHAKRIDTIVVYRLDRFSRDASYAIKTIIDLDSHGVAFISVTQPVLNLGHNNPFRRTMLAAFAEISQLESEATSIRVKAGLAVRRAKGLRLGPKVKITVDTVAQAKQLRDEGHSYRVIAERLGFSVGSIYMAIKKVDRG